MVGHLHGTRANNGEGYLRCSPSPALLQRLPLNEKTMGKVWVMIVEANRDQSLVDARASFCLTSQLIELESSSIQFNPDQFSLTNNFLRVLFLPSPHCLCC